MKKRKVFLYALLPVLGLTALGANYASAWGGPMSGFGPAATPDEIVARHSAMFEAQAKLLGVSVDEVKQAWAAGKTFVELAKEKGITALDLQKKMQASRLEQMQAQMKTLVDRGVITEAQADSRLQAMQTKQAGAGGRMGMGRGMHRGFGF